MIDTDYPLIATKFYTPKPRQGLVRRMHLIERINKGIRSKLTLVSAPAGFGKTTLLSEWIYWNKIPVAWISLDKGDNDPVDFLRYLIAAFQGLQADTGKTALLMLQSPQQPIENVLANFMEELSNAANECTIVLDDYHVVDTLEIHKLVEFLINHLPRQIHLVIATRADPPFPLSRLRARNQLNEFRTAELAFSQKETRLFFNKTLDLPLSNHEIDILESRTEGWIAGLQLAALSMQGLDNKEEFIRTFTGDNRHITDYLAEEVLSGQPESIQEFLLKTSILDHLSAPLCDFVVEGTDSITILHDLEKSNLFIIPLDNKRQWYRYHHLFSDLLRQQLQYRQGDMILEIQDRASRWYEQNGYREQAIDHALASRHFKRAANLIKEFTETSLESGRKGRLLEWFRILPTKYIHANPELCFYHAWVLFENGRYSATEETLQLLEAMMASKSENSGNYQPGEKRSLKGKLAVIRSRMASGRGNVPDILKYSKIALDYLPKEDLNWRAISELLLGIAYSNLGNMKAAIETFSRAASVSQKAHSGHLYLQSHYWLVARLKFAGQLQKAIEECTRMLALVKEADMPVAIVGAGLFVSYGDILYEVNDLERALTYINKGLAIAEKGHEVSIRGWSYYCLMRILYAQGNRSELDGILFKTKKLAQQHDLPAWQTSLNESWEARLWLMEGKLDKAVYWAEKKNFNLSAPRFSYSELGKIVFARILVAQNRWDDADILLENLLSDQEKGGRVLSQIETLLVKAQSCWIQGKEKEALVTIKNALSLAEPGGYIRIFLDEGPIITKLLQKVFDSKAKIPRIFLKKLLSAASVSKTIRAVGDLVEPLSERELEVLRLIEAGLPNKKIMNALFISLSTVKTHTKNIYSKLDVHSRTEAVAMAKKLNLL